MRLFIAINFNYNTKTKLLALCDELRSRSTRGNFSLPENFHLTLVFLGECNAKQTVIVKTVMDGLEIQPFELMVERIGRFKRGGEDTWWAGIRESKQLQYYHRDLTERLINAGFSLDTRIYSPHITLGREIVTDVMERMLQPFGETVNRIDLMKSERIKGKLTYTVIYNRGVDCT